MGKIIEVNISDLKFWKDNYRYGTAQNQDDAQQKLASTKYFQSLVVSITKYGYQENQLLTVSVDQTDDNKYLVYDGNRRLAAMRAIGAFEKINVYNENDKFLLNQILDREHNNSKAGSVRWTPVQQARREADKVRQELVLSDKAVTSLKCLTIIEESIGEDLNSEFALSTFQRLYSEDLLTKFEITIDDPLKPKVGKKDQIRTIVEDIQDGAITSRILNTAYTIHEYLRRVLADDDKGIRTNFSDDEDESSEDETPNRLFTTKQELKILSQYIDNNSFIRELACAPVGKYPHLLRLATRAIVDTLMNIQKGSIENPSSLNNGEVGPLYLKGTAYGHRTGDMRDLVNQLSKVAHLITTQANRGIIENDREKVETLIEAITNKIDSP